MKLHLRVMAIAVITSACASGAIQSLFSAYAVQNEMVPPTSGIYTGPQFSQKVGDAFRSVAGGNKGSSAPANVDGATVDGLRWIDDTTSLWVKKTYVNGGWAVEGAYNASDSTWLGVIGGGAPASIASGATVDLGSVPQANVLITGTSAVSAFGSSAPAGVIKIIRFDGALTLTHSGALTIPCGYNLTTAANDRAIVTHLGSGNWEVTQYTRDSGIPIDCSAVGKAEFTFAGATPPLHLPGDGRPIARSLYPAYLAKVTIAQNGTRISGNATIAVSNTVRMGAGMPVEATGINAGCTIASVVFNTSITLNSSSCVTASGTSTVTVFLTGYGSGGGSTTVGVKDCAGRSFAGRESTPSLLTASFFGGNSSAMGAIGGSESQTLLQPQLPAVAPTFTGNLLTVTTTDTHVVSAPGGFTNTNFFSGGGGPTKYLENTAQFGSVNSQGTPTGTISNLGSGAAHPIVQPTMIADCVVRVTP